MTKQEVLEILEKRVVEATEDYDSGRLERIETAIQVVKTLPRDDDDYWLFQDIGMQLTNEPSEHTLTEDFGTHKKITHTKGNKTWTTVEGSDG